MPETTESESRKLLRRLRDTMAEEAAGQARLDKITHLIADSMGTEVCSVYLFRDEETLELCATEGLNPEAVHETRMRLGEGLVGRVARTGKIVNSADAPKEKGFRYMPETGEEIYSSFLGIPVQRLGEKLGVLVVQSKEARQFSSDEVYALEVVAMVLAEMTELGAFVGEGAALKARHQQPVMFRGTTGQEGAAQEGRGGGEPSARVGLPAGLPVGDRGVHGDPDRHVRSLQPLPVHEERRAVGVEAVLGDELRGHQGGDVHLHAQQVAEGVGELVPREAARGLGAGGAPEGEGHAYTTLQQRYHAEPHTGRVALAAKLGIAKDRAVPPGRFTRVLRAYLDELKESR